MQEISKHTTHILSIVYTGKRVVKERLNYKLHCIIVRCVEGWSSPTLCTSCYGEIKKKKKKKKNVCRGTDRVFGRGGPLDKRLLESLRSIVV